MASPFKALVLAGILVHSFLLHAHLVLALVYRRRFDARYLNEVVISSVLKPPKIW